MMVVKSLICCVVTATLLLLVGDATAHQQAPSLAPAWNLTLASSTNIKPFTKNPAGAAYWHGSYTNGVAPSFYAVTTADGSLVVLDAASGRVLYKVDKFPSSSSSKEMLSRHVAGDENGVYVLQGSSLFQLDLMTGAIRSTFTLPGNVNTNPAQCSLQINAGTLIFTDADNIISFQTGPLRKLWAFSNLHNYAMGGIRIDAGGLGNVAWMESVSTGVNIVAVNKTGSQVFKHSFPHSQVAFAYVMQVDSFSVTYLQRFVAGHEQVCRQNVEQYPSPPVPPPAPYCITVATGSDHVAGYGLSCPQGGKSCGYTQLYLNFAAGYTKSYDYTTGKLVAVSEHHAVRHLVGMAKFASVSVDLPDGSVDMLAFNFETMKLRYNISLPSEIIAYDITTNWYNELLVPNPQKGFFFLFGASSHLDESLAGAFVSTGGIEMANTWVEASHVFTTSGSGVYCYSFQKS